MISHWIDTEMRIDLEKKGPLYFTSHYQMKQKQSKMIQRKINQKKTEIHVHWMVHTCWHESVQKGLMRVLRGGALLGGVIAMSR